MNNRKKGLIALGTGLLLGIAGVANADMTPGDSDGALRAELAALRARIAQLESRTQESWLNERRAEEIKNLAREVLADADSRTSFQGEGLTAGHDGKNFFIRDEGDTFRLVTFGQIQFRYTYNHQDEAAIDDNVAGFVLRRAKIGVKGHITANPKIDYKVRLSASRGTGTVRADTIIIGNQLSEHLYIKGGRMKAPFLREETTSPGSLLAVDRALVTEVFTAGYVEGAEIAYSGDMFKAAISINDGFGSGEVGGGAAMDFFAVDTDIAVTARVDARLMGDWNQMKDFAAWSGEPTAIFVGAAVHREEGETGVAGFPDADFTAWTVDASAECNGFNIYAAGHGLHVDFDSGTNADNYGVLVQGGYMIVPDKLEPFVRYEWVEIDGVDDDATLLTFGANYYINKHNAKFTADVVWGIDTLGAGAISGIGLRTDLPGEEDQIAVRAQLQILF